MPYPSDVQAAITNLESFYNGLPRSGANPGGFDADGHRVNFIPCLRDVATVSQAVGEAGESASTAAIAAHDALLAAESARSVAQAAADIASAQALAWRGTSSSSVTIATGTASFATQSGKSWWPGDFMMVVSTANTANWLFGQVLFYAGSTLTLGVQAMGGTGSASSWSLALVGPRGGTGPQGIQGIQGPQGTQGVQGPVGPKGDPGDASAVLPSPGPADDGKVPLAQGGVYVLSSAAPGGDSTLQGSMYC